MKKLFPSTIIISFLFILWGCPGGIHKKYDYDAYFPHTPANLTYANSSYDDYNSILPEFHYGKRLVFSSNRDTEGGNFSLRYDNFHVVWYMETSELIVDDDNIGDEYNMAHMISKVNWEGNEFGPYFIGFDTVVNGKHGRINLLAYATNNNEDTYHEEFIYSFTDNDGATTEFYGPFNMPFLTNSSQQQYISFYGPSVTSLNIWELKPNTFSDMYFDGFDKGQADIYKINIPTEKEFIAFLSDTATYEGQLISELSGPSNDRCPFINGSFMVFTSDRPGGSGGYDLYYSKFDGQDWSPPVNFGDQINSEYNEFRPVTLQVPEFKNDVMIFSSDRPGGKGGYDLYYAGIDKITPVPCIE